MVIIVMLRPHVLRHARNYAQHKTKRAVEPASAKQAAMATFMYQRKSTQRE